MPTFTPPVVFDRPSFTPDSTPVQQALFKYLQPANYYGRYVQVFALSDGSFVQDTATPENANTNVPYPWDPNDASAPFVTTTYYNLAVTPPVRVTDEQAHTVWILWMIDRPTPISTETATALSAAGYGAFIS